jgi:hypothetical protein
MKRFIERVIQVLIDDSGDRKTCLKFYLYKITKILELVSKILVIDNSNLKFEEIIFVYPSKN